MSAGNNRNQFDAASDQADANAQAARYQSYAIGANIASSKEDILGNLARYDAISNQQQGSAALLLAKSGAMTSRRTSTMYTDVEMGIDGLGPTDALAGIRTETETAQAALQAAIDAVTGAQSNIENTSALIDSLNKQITDLEVWGTETYKERVQDVTYTPAGDDDDKDERDAEEASARSDYVQMLVDRSDKDFDVDEEEDPKDARDRRRDSRDRRRVVTERTVEREHDVMTGYADDKLVKDLRDQISTASAQLSQYYTDLQTATDTYMTDGVYNDQEKVDYLTDLLTTVEATAAEIEKEAGGGVANLQQLQYTTGSTLVATSKALVMLRDQRDAILQGGIAGIIGMEQQKRGAEDAAAASAEQARQYTDMANQYNQQQAIQTWFQVGGFVAGAAAAPWTGGASLGVGLQAGSFLGNVFASRV